MLPVHTRRGDLNWKHDEGGRPKPENTIYSVHIGKWLLLNRVLARDTRTFPEVFQNIYEILSNILRNGQKIFLRFLISVTFYEFPHRTLLDTITIKELIT